MESLISVIVTVYNVKEYLGRCIESIIAQTYRKLQIIFVDDGSVDGSSELCDRYAKKDRRIQVLHQANGGPVRARKEGLRLAEGEFVTWVDGDDWIEEDYIERMAGVQADCGADLVSTGHCHDIGGTYSKEYDFFPTGCYQREDLIRNLIYSGIFFAYGIQPHQCGKLFRREKLLRVQLPVDERIVLGEDAAVVYPYILESEKICITNICAYHYVKRANSITKKITRNERNRLELLLDYLRKSFVRQRVADEMEFQLVQFKKYLMLLRCPEFFNENGIHPYGDIPAGSRILLYGAGVMGQRLYQDMVSEGNVHVTEWLDLNWDIYQGQGLEVESPEKIDEMDGSYDYILIAVIRQDTANAIKKILMKKGVPERKILWLTEDFIGKAE